MEYESHRTIKKVYVVIIDIIMTLFIKKYLEQHGDTLLFIIRHHHISSTSHPSETANKARYCLK